MPAVSLKPAPCAEIEPLLDPSVDGELLDDDRAIVLGHIATCAACRARHEARARLKALVIQAGRTVELPPALEARVRSDMQRHRRARRLRTAAGVIAAASVAAALAFVLVDGKGAAPPPVTPVLVEAAFSRHGLDVPVDVATPDPRRVQEFLATRVGPMQVPRLDGLGWGLSGARVVDVADRRGAQLVYAGGFGQRLSVLAVPDPDGGLARSLGAGPVERQAGALRARTFVAAGNSVVSVVGELDHDRLRAVSYEFER